jgi:hypothetical protein
MGGTALHVYFVTRFVLPFRPAVTVAPAANCALAVATA